ncbi:hypothetical protein MSG28_006298, partial [Choristoneura fumiferana]
ACVAFLKKQAASLNLAVTVHEIVPKKPIVVLTWTGTDPTLPSILLNSHMDVVPVFEKSWTHPPFSAHIDKDGKIFARGSQDMKCVGIQYLEAIRKLRAANVQLKRTLHVTFVPDEEIGGHDGMMKFVHTAEFKALKVGFALDEGIASPEEEFILFYGERSIWQIHVHCTGKTGHGSLIHLNTAGEKLRYIIDKFMDLREQQKRILESDPKLTTGDVTTINMTQIYGGVQSNVVPEKLSVVFDMRLAITVNHEEFENMIKQWCREAGDGVTYDFEQKNDKVDSTKLDAGNPYWIAFKAAADELYSDASIMTDPGKQRKTRKIVEKRFAQMKKMISPSDSRIKASERAPPKKKKPEDPNKLKIREAPQASSALFFQYNTQLGPPYHILIDTNFINFSIKNKLDIVQNMMDCLYAKCIPYITDCVLGELEKLGRKYRVALRIIKDPRFERLACLHKGTYADDCIVQRVTQHKSYIVATNDKDLKRRIRKIPGVPIMYVADHKYTIERMPDAYGAPKGAI